MSGRGRSPTIADVAREAGVSISTVSRFINDSALVADETVSRVRDAIKQLGYQPRSAARNLALRRTNTLGILLESIGDWFFPTVIAGAEETAYEAGYNVLISRQSHVDDGVIPAIGPHNTDGLLAINIPMTATLATYQEEGYPIVSLYHPVPKSMHIPFVTIQNKRGVFMLIDHLIRDHGMRRIGFFRGSESKYDSYWREQGYRQALKKYNIPTDESLIIDLGYNCTRANEVIKEMVRANNLPQAFFTGSDEGALYVLMALNAVGVRVPDDLALVGFDDTDLSKRLYPPLTTVHTPIAEVGKEGARKLMQLVRTGQADLVTSLPTHVVLRKSCGCPDPSGVDLVLPVRAEACVGAESPELEK